MADVATVLVYFGVGALVFLAVGFVYLSHCDRRDRRETRDIRRDMRSAR